MELKNVMNNPKEMEFLHPNLRNKMIELYEECKKEGIEIRFSDTYRTIEQQNALYAFGRFVPGKIVTKVSGSSMSSQHQWGIAADFYLKMDIDGDGDTRDDAFNNATGMFNKVGTIAKKNGLGWGGDWKFVDMPHVYLPYWGDTTRLLKDKYGSYEKFRKEDFNEKIIEAGDYEKSGNCWDEESWIMAVQSCIGAKVDGIVGSETISKTPTISRYKNNKHLVVFHMQKKLNYLGCNCGKEDGIAGVLFEEAAIKFQGKFLRKPDGEFTSGNISWRKLLGK